MRIARCSGLFLLALVLLAGCGSKDKPLSHMTLDLGQKDAKGQAVAMEFVLIPSGEFLMGSPSTEANRKDDESPTRKVTLSKPFYMGMCEVTQGQYEAVVGSNPSKTVAVDNPVENLSWNLAQKFCEQMSAKTKKKVRLPTEAEWEYACRAGTTGAYSCPDDSQLGYYAWFKGNAADNHHPVGQKKPNPWGLFDMHGNVSEFVFDRSAKYDPAVTLDPTGSGSGAIRIVRGGSYNNAAADLRSARRFTSGESSADSETGFRVVVEKE